jgi:hypothetical protein
MTDDDRAEGCGCVLLALVTFWMCVILVVFVIVRSWQP